MPHFTVPDRREARERFSPSSRAGSQLRNRRGLLLRIGPGEDLETAVLVFDQRRAALDPVAAIHVADAVLVADDSAMDVAADHAISAMPARLGGQRRLERADVVHRV